MISEPRDKAKITTVTFLQFKLKFEGCLLQNVQCESKK